MLVAEIRTRIIPAGEHLELMRALAHELERAMQAIARNDLRELEDSIAIQQSLCLRLSISSQQFAESSRMSAGTAQLPDPEIKRQIGDATDELKKLNQRYSILLMHSSRSAQMMALLFSSYRGQIKEASGQGPNDQSRPDRRDSRWEA
jgi:flagellar biosynthesis/type III secretory pathway chaperone